MSHRVVATPQALAAARQMKQILDGDLTTSIEQLRKCGMALSNPAMWDGPMARDFRSTMWPRSRVTMERTLTQLGNMQRWALKINEDIMRAGNEGSVAAAGGPSAQNNPFVAAPIVYDASHLSLRSFYQAAKATWNNPSTLKDHLQRHWMDVGRPWSQGMYANEATKFLLEAQKAGYEVKVAGNTLRVFDPATTRFASYTLDGRTRTIFNPETLRPGTGATYFQNPSYGHPATPAELNRAMAGATQDLDNAVKSPFAKMGQLLDTPVGRFANRTLGALGAAGDVLTIANPSPNALGGQETERWMAAANLGALAVTAGPVATLLAANAALDWVPVVGEVVMVGTALYFAGDLIYQNREAIGHALSSAEHAVAGVTSDIGKGLAGGVSHAWHGLFG